MLVGNIAVRPHADVFLLQDEHRGLITLDHVLLTNQHMLLGYRLAVSLHLQEMYAQHVLLIGKVVGVLLEAYTF